jgi:hypothetical protein
MRFRFGAIALLFCIFPAGEAGAFRAIRTSCAIDKPIKAASLDEVYKAVCDFTQHYSKDTQISRQVSGIQTIIETLRASAATDWADDSELNHELDRLADMINARDIRSKGPPRPAASGDKAGQFRLELNAFLAKYADAADRIKAGVGYFSDMTRVLSLTDTGKRVLHCFANNLSATPGGPAIITGTFYDIDNKTDVMHASLINDPKRPGNYLKRLHVSATPDPVQAMSLLVHEQSHLCNMEMAVKVKKVLEQAAKKKTKPSYPVDLQEDMFVDEMRSYRNGFEVIAELTEKAPDQLCGRKTSSKLLGRVATVGESYSHVQELFDQGAFHREISKRYWYADCVLYSCANGVVQRGPDRNPIVKPALAAKLTAAGFNVK